MDSLPNCKAGDDITPNYLKKKRLRSRKNEKDVEEMKRRRAEAEAEAKIINIVTYEKYYIYYTGINYLITLSANEPLHEYKWRLLRQIERSNWATRKCFY